MVAKAMAVQHQSKQQMFKLPVELQNMVNFYTPTKDILQSREAQEMLMGMCFNFIKVKNFNYIILYFKNRNKTWGSNVTSFSRSMEKDKY